MVSAALLELHKDVGYVVCLLSLNCVNEAEDIDIVGSETWDVPSGKGDGAVMGRIIKGRCLSCCECVLGHSILPTCAPCSGRAKMPMCAWDGEACAFMGNGVAGGDAFTVYVCMILQS